MMKSDSQRRLPLTERPMPGTSTSASNRAAPANTHGASCCHAFIGIWKATSAATRPAATKTPCRTRKYQARNPVYDDASDIAIDAEYTMTSPAASRSSETHASDAS
jgi:hypothetical protein